MDELVAASRAGVPMRRGALLVPLLLLACVVAMGGNTAVSAAAPPAEPSASLHAPGAFRLVASNGYTLDVIAEPSRSGPQGTLRIIASAKDSYASYSVPATVTETSMQADLGALGQIAVTFRRSDEANTFTCGKRKISFDSGSYQGTVSFHGEEGYTDVEATSVPGNVDYLRGFCSPGFLDGSEGPPHGAYLEVRNPGLGPRMSVGDSRPGGRAVISASTQEYSDGIRIERDVGLRMPGRDFTYDRRLRTATVRPPAPFLGSGSFDLAKKAGQRWSGDLAVDLPGRSDVPLIDPSFRATLSRGG